MCVSFLLFSCPIVTYAFRANHAADISKVQGDDRCVFTAGPSDPEKIDMNSLIFKDPDFTFFDSREFFLSSKPSCLEKLDNVELRSVPNTTAGKQMQQERRFKVKQLKEGMNVLSKRDAKAAQKLFLQMRSTSTAELPAVELHMFPDEPSDLDSKWHVLLVPKARELFGKPVYLCQPIKASQSSAGNYEEASPRCVSRLDFDPLPWRLMNTVGDWDPALDTTRSVPHKWIFGLELLLLFSALLIVCKTALPVFKLIDLSLRKDEKKEDTEALEVKKLLEQPLPKSYQLSQHLGVCENVEGDSLVPDVILEASDEVEVMEVKATEGNKSGGKVRRLVNRVMSCMSSKKPQAVWGRLQKPERGWILLYDGARGKQKAVIENSSEPVYRANMQLMIPFGTLLRRQLVLSASHVSVQWLMLEQLARHLPVPCFITVAVTFFVLHVFVLCQVEWTARWGHRCDEVLEHQMRLEPPKGHVVRNFLMITAVLILSILVGLLPIGTTPGSSDTGWSFLNPCFGLMGVVAVHAWDLKSSSTGLSKWREPQIATEHTAFMGKKLPKSTEVLPLNPTRERACLIIDFSTWLMASAGLTCLILLGLDAFSMQGALTDYSFSKGHLTYMSENVAFHNTLLLHDATDSVVFFFKAGSHTKNITMTLEHPQLNETTTNENKNIPLPLHAGEYEISIPAGPLYSRIVVEAKSFLRIRPTRYTFHVVRVGESLSLRLSGEVNSLEPNATNETKAWFLEERRWLFQKKNPDWYVPDLKPETEWSLEVTLHPVCYAPLKPATSKKEKQEAHIVHQATNCQCGYLAPGFGTECAKEDTVKLPDSSERCVYLRSVTDEIQVNESSKSSLSTGLDIISWLQDVYMSGKYAGLRLAQRTGGQGGQKKGRGLPGPQQWHFNVANMSTFNISNVFNASIPVDLLLQSTELDVATTQDETDAEEERLALRIIPHPPPVSIKFEEDNSSKAFLLPPFAVNNKRSEYAACHLPNLKLLHGDVFDTRFRADEQQVNLGKDCFDIPQTQKRFRAVRNETCEFCNRYTAWNENFDVAVTLSHERCVMEAIDLNRLKDLHRLLEGWIHVTKESEQKCSVMQRAVRLGRVKMIQELLKEPASWDVNCHKCAETPLGVAAAEGKMESLTFLLQQNESSTELEIDGVDLNGATALVRAVRHCQAAAAKLLLEKGSNVNHTMPMFRGTQCLMTPLLALARVDLLDAVCSGDKLKEMLQVLRRAGAAFSLPATEECSVPRTALTEVIAHRNLQAVPVLLELGAGANEKGQEGSPLEDLVTVLLNSLKPGKKELPWPSFTAAAEALLAHDADINVRFHTMNRTLLMQAAMKCHAPLVKFLVDKGADVAAEDKKGRTVMVYAEKSRACGDNEATKKEDMKESLKEKSGT